MLFQLEPAGVSEHIAHTTPGRPAQGGVLLALEGLRQREARRAARQGLRRDGRAGGEVREGGRSGREVREGGRLVGPVFGWLGCISSSSTHTHVNTDFLCAVIITTTE